jgi:threonine aldolase
MESSQVKEIKRHFDIVAEGLRDEIKTVAEGVVGLKEQFEKEITEFRKENKEAHSDIMVAIKFSYTEA